MKKIFFTTILGIALVTMMSGCSMNEEVEWKDYTYRGCYNYSSYTICRWIVINGSSCSVKSNFGTDYSEATTDASKCRLSQTSDGKISGVSLWTDNALKTDYYSFSDGTFTYNNGNGDFHSSIRKFEKDAKK